MTESQYYKKNKICVDCKYFSWFMGSAGFCTKEESCADGMIDCMDSCKNGFYKHKIRPDIFVLELRCKIQRARDRIFKKKTETRSKKKEVDLTEFHF
jgi:hypothetical protein